MDASPHRDLLSFLAEIPDPRSRHGRQHSLSAVLGLVCCAIIYGAGSDAAIAPWAVDHDIAFMHRFGFTRTLPKLGGIRKVLIALGTFSLPTPGPVNSADTLGGQGVPRSRIKPL